MSIARATTPTFTLTFTDDELDLTQMANVYVTFEQRSKSLTKSDNDIDIEQKQVSVYLDQEETLMFAEGVVEIQVNWTMPNGKRACSEVGSFILTKQLLRRVVE